MATTTLQNSSIGKSNAAVMQDAKFCKAYTPVDNQTFVDQSGQPLLVKILVLGIGSGATVTALDAAGNSVAFAGLVANQVLPGLWSCVMLTGTLATVAIQW